MNETIHRSPWPTLEEFAPVTDPTSPKTYEIVCAVIEAVRKAKAEKNLSMKAPVVRVGISAPVETLAAMAPSIDDIKGMLHIESLETREATPTAMLTDVTVEF
jgi:valyl-tRNA synthetase